MTSNIGARNIADNKKIGFGDGDSKATNYGDIKKNVMDELKKAFRPEFLNRLDEIIVFKQLGEKEIEEIVDLMLKDSISRLKERDIKVKIAESMKKFISKKGFDPLYGARPLKRVIQTEVEDKLAEAILEGKIKDGDSVTISRVDDKTIIE